MGTLGLAVAMFGSTGVGADEMTTSTYWCLEKGYARWTGPDDGSEERSRWAEGWLRVMRLEVGASWVVCTLCTLSFYVIGAAVLQPHGLVPEDNAMITTLSHTYTDTLGPWAEYLFLVGAIAVLYSTNIGSTASVPRLWTNPLGILGVIDWQDVHQRRRTIRLLTVCLPSIWAAFFLFVQEPVLMVAIGGIGSGIFLLAVGGRGLASARDRGGQTLPREPAHGGLAVSGLITVSGLFTVRGVYTVREVFGIAVSGS